MIQSRTVDAGPVAVRPTGDFNEGTIYELLQEVLHDHDSWISLTNGNKGHEPVEGSIYWFRSTKGGKAAYLASLRALDAAQSAENVNVELAGMTLTITNREGSSRSVNIGFEIYNTYGSVAEMEADAANVPTGKFVTIATDDPTSEENARLYGKRNDGTFRLLSDLDQASSAAWADWLENMKPLILADHQTALRDHEQANIDHEQAEDDHRKALEATSSANDQAKYAKNQGDYAKDMADHGSYVADGTDEHPGDVGYFYSWDYSSQEYKKGARLAMDWESMTEEQRRALAEYIMGQIVYATPEEAREAAEDLN